MHAMADTGTVIFLHLGKTGGMTLKRVVQRQYPAGNSYAIEGKDVRAAIAAFAGLPECERRLRLLSGHVHYGVHELLPQPAVYFTVLRDPVERVASLYHYIRSRPGHHLYDAIERQRMSVADFVRSGISVEADNGQTRLLAGPDGRSLPFGTCTTELLERARANLARHFAVVGLTERFDETLLLLRDAFGWRRLFYVRRNVTDRRIRRDTLDAEAMCAIEERNTLDIELYRDASAAFEERIREQGPVFHARLRLLRLENALYGRLRSVRARLAT